MITKAREALWAPLESVSEPPKEMALVFALVNSHSRWAHKNAFWKLQLDIVIAQGLPERNGTDGMEAEEE